MPRSKRNQAELQIESMTQAERQAHRDELTDAGMYPDDSIWGDKRTFPPRESSQDALADVLRRILLAIRCKGMGGQKAPYMADRCVLCNRPHGPNRPCACAHHDAVTLLESLGIEVDS